MFPLKLCLPAVRLLYLKPRYRLPLFEVGSAARQSKTRTTTVYLQFCIANSGTRTLSGHAEVILNVEVWEYIVPSILFDPFCYLTLHHVALYFYAYF